MGTAGRGCHGAEGVTGAQESDPASGKDRPPRLGLFSLRKGLQGLSTKQGSRLWAGGGLPCSRDLV